MSESLLVARWSSPCEKRAIMTIHVHHRRFEACTIRRKRGRMGVRRKRGREALLRSSIICPCSCPCLFLRRLCLFHLFLGLSPFLSPFQPFSIRKLASCRWLSLVRFSVPSVLLQFLRTPPMRSRFVWPYAGQCPSAHLESCNARRSTLEYGLDRCPLAHRAANAQLKTTTDL